jgi:hypothetical protein
MNPEATNLLEQLRDIHGAPQAPWWPPAPGWWVLAAVLLVVCLLIGRRLLRGLRDKKRRRGWLQHLEETVISIDPRARPQDFLARLNQVFKAVAMRAFPDEGCARLEGIAWTGFLQDRLNLDQASAELQVLGDGPYQPAPEFDAEAVTRLARDWIVKYG